MVDELSKTAQLAREYDTIVVGAGIAGLAYAHARGAAADVLVLEGSDRPGGVIVTEQGSTTGDAEADGFHYECGPEALQDNAPETLALLDELGLQTLPASSSAGQRWILLARDHLVPVPTGPKALLTSKLLTLSAKWRLAKGLWSHSPGDCDGSLAHFIRSRFGSELLERLVDPAISGIYAGDPELISLRAAFPTLYDLASEHGSLLAGLRAKGRARRAAVKEGSAPAPRKGPPSLLSVAGGLESLPRAIASGLGERLVLKCRVAAVTREGQGWLVQSADGTEYRARQVVLALPVAQAAAVLSSSIPEISEACASQHSESVINLVHLWRREDIAHPLDGFGYLVPSKLGVSHLGTLFSSSIQPGRCPSDQVLLRTLMGGARRPELLQLDHEQLLEIVVKDVGGTLGISSGARPLFSRTVRWPGVLPRYDLDHPARQATIQGMLAGNPGLEIIGNHRLGISVNALIASSRLLARRHREGDQFHA
ncbi:MAG: oxygen-dependent protoporphyrinogen oxidase [Pseudohongiellaceae bacterium]|jgi:oxygen-dependent protoporphyrinogen oxidase